MTDDANAYQERQRALARERQQRSRDRRRNGRDAHVTQIIDRDTGKPSLTLTNIAKNLVAGMTDNGALVAAGSSRNATVLIDKAKQGLADVLQAKGLTISKVIDNTLARLDATSPMLTASGSIERPDWTAQASGARDGIALLDRAGELPQAQAPQSGASITINIVRFDTPQDVAIEAQFTRGEESSP